MSRRSVPLFALALGFAACADSSETPLASPDTELKFRQVRRDRGAEPIPGQYIVVMREEAAAARASAEALTEEMVASAHAEMVTRLDGGVSGFAARMSEKDARALAARSDVKYVEQDQMMYPTATQANPTWGLDRIDQRALPLSASYTYTSTGAGVRVYIVDTGIRTTHAQFGTRASAVYDGINDGRNGQDCNGHGTHVAGTVGGSTYGVAKGALLRAVRVFGCTGGSANSTIIAAVNWIRTNHIKPAVANMSLGGGASQALDDAVTAAINAGVTFAVAAGNSNVNACGTSPARAAAAITVGSTTSTDARSSFSNFGSCLDLFAPGSSITSAWWTSNTAINTISGTSMATPHVAGVAALILAGNPTATPATVRSAIVGNATTGVVTGAQTGSPNRLLFTNY